MQCHSRRDFLRNAALASVALSMRASAAPAPAAFNAVQIHPFSFYDEGIERVLDLLQETAGINALLVYSHLYGADQGVPVECLAHDHPGYTPVAPSARRYRRVWARHGAGAFDGHLLRHPAAEHDVEYAGRDLFAELAPLCRVRGMKLMGRILEPRGSNYDGVIAGWAEASTVDITGQARRNACWNNPDYRAFWLTTVTDTFRQNPLEGFMLGAERTGPLYRLLAEGEPPSCFCRHCQARMKAKGVDETRLRAGYTALNEWVQTMRREPKRSADGALVTFLRLLMHHPEVLVWEREWALSLEEALAQLARGIKSVKPDALVGRHVDHQQTSWDIFYRAAVTYAEMAAAMDFLKPVVYHDITAPRVERWVLGELGKSLLADLSKPQALDFYYAVFGLNATKEPALDALMSGGFSPDYVFRETRRCVDGVAGKARVYPGIGFDIPIHRKDGPPVPHPSNHEVLYEATKKAFEAGAQGIVVCREYQEMRLPNLRAVGRALRELGKR
jgi:hypothetical protein